MRSWAWSVMLMSVLLASNASADSKQDYFDAGVKASEKGNYSIALQHFKNAKKVGLDTPALKYNLAVCYYKLGQFETARKHFSKLTDVPAFEQVAYFNLGLIANKQKDEKAAIRWFQRAYRDESNGKVSLLAKEALKRLGVSASKTRRADKIWTGFVSMAMESDSNVALVNDDLQGVAGQSDTAVDLMATATRWLKGGVTNGVRMSFGGNLQQYSKYSEYDYSQFSARVMRYNLLGDWNVRMGGSWNEVYFNGREYQRIVGADLRGRKKYSAGKYILLRYKLNRVQATNAIYDYLDGWRQQFRIGVQEDMGKDRVRYYYQLELNNREDRDEGTVDPFISYSPTRHSFRVTGWWRFAGGWRTRLDGRYRYSRYNDENILLGNIAQRREDSQLRLSARVSRVVARDWDVSAQLSQTNNDSNLDRKSYDRTVLSLGVSRFF